jgi:SAM-dependent methyltransferase
MIQRILEPELMDSAEDAREYDAMDHSVVNAQFVTDLLAALQKGESPNYRPTTSQPSDSSAAIIGPVSFLRVSDLGAGTGQIPIELARRAPTIHVTAVDAARSMLPLASRNIDVAGLTDRIEFVLADAKHLPFDSESFPAVISNSIVHHIPNPHEVITEAVRVTAPGGLLFHRDLARPAGEAELRHLVETYAGDATPYQRKIFAESLRAALTADEMGDIVAMFGFARDSVSMTSDRHWTWSVKKK